MAHGSDPGDRTGLEVAVVGMAGRFPGAGDIHAFWRNLRGGVDSIARFTREELLEAGTDAEAMEHPGFVPAYGELGDADRFDAALFGLTPRDAEILDPQHRVLLECAWSALEHAGYDSARIDRPVGVFAGCTTTYGYRQGLENTPEVMRGVGGMRIALGTSVDHLAAGISYRLNLRGPSLAVQTACSTSLVAVHLACQSLVAGECDLALAGGVSVSLPLRSGYVYVPDGILSPDGRCRAFDAEARGTVAGSGAGMVALRRLEDALADGDTIHAVIRGSAINNDGAQKVGYTAPSVAGETRVLSEALSVAGVDPATVQYLETHGSGTPLGDAIELKAIGQVLARSAAGHRCAIGSVKTNVGHLDAAAGVAGLIKTVLALSNREIPPSLHFEVPHPELEASGGRVFVNTALAPWTRNGTPRRAGVSSFGIGGTNAHVVLEEAPPAHPSAPGRPLELLVLSARTAPALQKAAENLADFLESDAPALPDAAWTLQTGRREMEHRLAVVCRDAADGAARLRQAATRRSAGVPRAGGTPVAFMFPGVGMQYAGMGRGLYDAESVYRAAVDECCELLRPVLGSDLRDVLFAAAAEDAVEYGDRKPSAGGGWDLRRLLGRGGEEAAPAASPLDETRFAQPAVFVVGYALARLWMSWGVTPRALIGHSLGEYVAATVAGVLRLEDALTLVAHRARLIAALPAGAMVAVPLGEEALREILPPALDLAAVNTPESCVVAGPLAEVEAFEAALAERGTVSRRLAAEHAFHSRAMRPVAAELERLLAGFHLRAPEIPFVSNVTGDWISDAEAQSPAYWARHLCQPVRFADGVATLRREPGWALVELGPGQVLGAWALQHPAGGGAEGHAVLGSLRHQHNRVDDLRLLMETLGAAWAAGVEVDWAAFAGGARRRRVPLPGYPFERRRFWIEPPRMDGMRNGRAADGDGAGADGAADLQQDQVMDIEVPVHEARTAAPSRVPAVIHLLTGIVSELTGLDESFVDAGTDFFQQGLDSLILLQLLQSLEKRTGVRVSLVELMEDLTTIGAVAAHLDAVLPEDAELPEVPGAAPAVAAAAVAESTAVAVAAPAIAVPAAPAPTVAETGRTVIPAPPAFYPPIPQSPAASTPAPAGDDGLLERVIAMQLQVMAQQIAAVRGQPASAPADASASVPASPAAVESAPVASSAPVAPVESSAPVAPVDAASANGAAPRAVAPASVPQSPRARIQPETFVAYRPLNTEGPGGLTAEQREYLDGFIARYTERTRASKAHQERFHVPLADGRVTARFRRAFKEMLYPIVSERGAGSRIWDLDGNEYVDDGMAFGCSLFGHAPEFITRAIREQAERGFPLGPQSPYAGRAAELICELGGNDRAVFCNSGTEAVMGAVRAARALTGRSKVALFAGSYHGWSDLVLGRLVTAGGQRRVLPSAPGVPALPLGDVLMLDYDEPASLELLARHMDEIALVMVEPVQSRRPDVQPFAFLHELRRMTREAGVLLHFDELITGFRMGPGGAQAHFGIQADLVTYGKIVGAGLPMGVVAGTREAMSVFDGGVWRYGDESYPTAQRTLFAGAYFKHPISMAVTCAVLEEIRRQGAPMYDRLNAGTTRLVERLNAFFEAGRYPMTTVHCASCFRFFFTDEVRFPDLFEHHLILEGIHIMPETGTHFISVAHDEADLETVFRAVCRAAEAMRQGGFLPPAPGGNGGPPAPSPSPVRAHAATPPAALNPSIRIAEASVDSAAERGDDGVRVLPLTDGQRQLWFESQMGDEAALAYLESSSARLTGTLDEAALLRAIQALVDRHDTLRMTFGRDGDVQRIHPRMKVEVARADFRGATPREREDRVEAWLRETVRRPFDLVDGPLVRFALAALEQDEHLLVTTFHHAAMDGWSSGVVWGDLGELYAAFREGCPAALPPRPDHAALVCEQVAAVQGNAAADAFWAGEFADGVPVLELPTDRPRPALRSYAGERARRVMGSGLMVRLAEAGRRHGLTLFNTLLSAHFVWLSRLSGDDDVVVGTPAAGQAGRGGAAELVGYGINILPVRAKLDPAQTFAEHARGVRRTVLRAMEHQNFSFPRLVETLLHGRDPARPPLFSAAMILDRAAGESFLGDLRASFDSNFTGGSKLDISFVLTETEEDDLRLDCDYATALFDGAIIDRWLASFEYLLQQIADDPQVPLARLEMLPAADRAVVVEEWSGTERPYDATPVHRLVAAQAARTPDAAALAYGARTVTYAEMDAAANRLAHHLVARGAGPETLVAIVAGRTPETVIAMLAVLKAGAAYLPLDPSYPAERLRQMLADSGARLVIARGALPAGVEIKGIDVVDPGAEAEAIAARPADAPAVAVHAESLAYVIYTSGSTGRPKGVAVTHRGIPNLAAWKPARLGDSADERVLQFASFSFDSAVLELFAALVHGSTLVMAEREALMPGEPLQDTLRRERVTVAILPPTALAVLDPAGLPDLRVVVSAGEALPASVAARWADALELHNGYGPTEGTVATSTGRVHADGREPSIGRPLDNVRVYLLDGAGRPVPVGVAGELYAGGAGLARGYLGRPALTAERFVPDPFGRPGARLYRTGDRARWRADGTLAFAGRADEQVKIRGFRIEPGEIEAVLRGHPAVADCAVVARGDAPGEKRLVAYVVGAAGADELRTLLRGRVPEFMVPGAFVALEALPLTPNGKVDRKALPAPEPAAAGDAFVAARTPAEEVLAGIWGEVLGLDRVGAHDGFFDLGGHSLLATRMVSRVRDVFGVELPLRTLFEAPTVAALAGRIEALRHAGAPQLPPVVPVDRAQAPPLSFAQERLWFLDRLQPGGVFYNVPAPMRLKGALDAAALERALGEIVRRHEVLRTTFADVDGRPVQVIAPFDGFVLPVKDLSRLLMSERDAEVRRRASAEATRPFDLAAGPLFRARLLRLADDDHALLMDLHHAVTDGWSMGVLFRELSALYETYRNGEESVLPPLSVQYADFAAWQRAQLHGPMLERQLAYWSERLAGAPALLELPADHPRPAVMTFRGAYEPMELSAELQQRLQALARREGATLYMVLLAAFQALLGRYAASDDIVVGTTTAGRSRGETEGLIGLFMNTLALRTDLSGDPTFRQALGRVRETVLGAFEHQDVPFERLVAELRPERSLSHSPVFQVLFEVHQDEAAAAGGLPGLRMTGVDAEAGTAKYDLAVALTSTPHGLIGALTYSTDLFERGTARRMVEHLERVLAQVADDADRRLSRLELMSRTERARVLEWNRTTAKYPAEQCIHQLFQEQARRTPDAAAVTFGGVEMAYRELDARANRIANHLRGRGVGAEVRVGVCMERSLDLLPAILGVMKAGGAYVPMDPAHPAERLAYVMEDSGASIVLTQEALRDRFAARDGVTVVAVDADAARIAAESAEAPETGVTAENLCYVIYTSGSTGRPKGVAMHHRGVCNYLHWGARAYGADEGSGAPVFSSMAVDLTITNLLPLFAGRAVHLLPEENPVEALAAVLRGGPGFGLVKITPVHLSLLTPLLTPEEARAAARTLVIGADFLNAEPTVFWQDHAPGVRLMNEYGPTETVVGCSAYVLPAGRHRAGPVPVGRPIQNLTFHVLDAHLEPVPVALPGELYIGGAGVARGYLGRPSLTAEKFVPDPFAEPGARMYRTGDRARWLHDGNLLILGRTDHQVKVRGFRVEPGEIEAVIRRRPEVRECLVVVREDRPGDRRLVAYVVGDASAETLRDELRRSLPEYMVPAAFVPLESLPQTPTGKLDPRALPAPAYAQAAAADDEPENYVEAQLIQLWEELLGVEGIGPTQDFFDLGGNSFLALRLFAVANRRLGCDLPVATLFAGGTVRHMAQAVLRQREAAPEEPAAVVPLQPHGALPPVFFVHSADRNVMGYVNLVRHLGPEQPAYGIRDLGDMARPVARIAADHVQAIRAVQPQGPYYLASWSFGGIVAYEMAVQLQAEGETVAFLGMLDTLSPVLSRKWGWDREADVVVALAQDAAARMRKPFVLSADALGGLELDAQVAAAVEALHAQGAAPPDYDPVELRESVGMVLDRIRSAADYVPAPFRGTLTLFRATEGREKHEEMFATGSEEEKHTMGWSAYAGAVEVHAVPGAHAVLGAEPHVRTLVGRMRDSLAAARARAASAATVEVSA